jgi:hypothetical protein
MELNLFMGITLPKDIGYYVFPTTVEFYRKNSFNEWNKIGFIPKPYNELPMAWWKEELKQIIDNKL